MDEDGGVEPDGDDELVELVVLNTRHGPLMRGVQPVQVGASGDVIERHLTFIITNGELEYTREVPKTGIILITGVKTAINVLHTPLPHIKHPQVFLSKYVNFIPALIKVHPFDRQFLLVLNLLYDLLLVLEVNVVNAGTQHSDLADFYHVQEVCYHRLVTEVYCLDACQVLEVP